MWLQTVASGKPVKYKNWKKTRTFSSDLVSSGTLLLSTQLSCNWTDSGVVGPSPVPGAGAWMGLRPPLRVFLFRLLADWWDKVWWLCGGGSGGRSVDWLWWLAAPARKTRKGLGLLYQRASQMKELEDFITKRLQIQKQNPNVIWYFVVYFSVCQKQSSSASK